MAEIFYSLGSGQPPLIDDRADLGKLEVKACRPKLEISHLIGNGLAQLLRLQIESLLGESEIPYRIRTRLPKDLTKKVLGRRTPLSDPIRSGQKKTRHKTGQKERKNHLL